MQIKKHIILKILMIEEVDNNSKQEQNTLV